MWRSRDRAPLILNLSTIRKRVVKVPAALPAEKVTTVPFEETAEWVPVHKNPFHVPEIETIYIYI
jgi:hypothetical protein